MDGTARVARPRQSGSDHLRPRSPIAGNAFAHGQVGLTRETGSRARQHPAQCNRCHQNERHFELELWQVGLVPGSAGSAWRSIPRGSLDEGDESRPMEATQALKVKVGALVLAALALLAAFVMVLGNVSFGARRTLVVAFADSGSLLTGAPVKIAGVRAGKVQSVAFVAGRAGEAEGPPVNVRVTVSIDEAMAAAVRHDSEFLITTQGVLGEKYLEIVPGSANSAEWAEGSEVRGSDPPRIDVLFSRVDRILGQVEVAMGAEGGLPIGELVATLGRLAKNLDDLLVANRTHLDALLAGLPAAVDEGRGLLAALRAGAGDGSQIRETLENVRQASAVAAHDLGPLSAKAQHTLGRVDHTLAAADRLLGTADTTVNELRPELKASVSKAAAMLDRLGPVAVRVDAVLHDAQWITDHIRRGQGTVGALLADQVIYDDLKAMLRDLKRNPWKFLWKE